MGRRKFLLNLSLTPILAAVAWGGMKGARYQVRRPAGAPSKDGRAAGIQSDVLEFTVTADEPFPVRALDPVLHVGGYEIREYRYMNMQNTALRFTCAEGDKLEDNAVVYFQYDNDARTRTDLPNFRLTMVE